MSFCSLFILSSLSIILSCFISSTTSCVCLAVCSLILCFLRILHSFEKRVRFVLTESLFCGTIYPARQTGSDRTKKFRCETDWEKCTISAMRFVQNSEKAKKHKMDGKALDRQYKMWYNRKRRNTRYCASCIYVPTETQNMGFASHGIDQHPKRRSPNEYHQTKRY